MAQRIADVAPHDSTDTTITFMYKIAFTYRLNVGEAAALSVLNVAFLIIIVGFYLRRVRWTETGETAVVTGAGGHGASRTAGIHRWGGRARRAGLGFAGGRWAFQPWASSSRRSSWRPTQ